MNKSVHSSSRGFFIRDLLGDVIGARSHTLKVSPGSSESSSTAPNDSSSPSESTDTHPESASTGKLLPLQVPSAKSPAPGSNALGQYTTPVTPASGSDSVDTASGDLCAPTGTTFTLAEQLREKLLRQDDGNSGSLVILTGKTIHLLHWELLAVVSSP